MGSSRERASTKRSPTATELGAENRQADLQPRGNAAAQEALQSEHAPLQADLSAVDDVSAPATGSATLDEEFARHVALTFDDGPTPDHLPRILQILDDHDVPATFFINGDQVDTDEARAQLDDIMAQEERHLIASHTEHHTAKRDKDPDYVREEIAGMDDELIEPYLREGQPKYVRFPYGAADSSEIGIAEDEGYVSVGWDVDSADWCYGEDTEENPEGLCNWAPKWGGPGTTGDQTDMVGYTVDQVEAEQGGIVLLHDKYSHTPDQLEALILQLEAKGYTFTTVDDAEAFPKLAKYSQQVASEQEASE